MAEIIDYPTPPPFGIPDPSGAIITVPGAPPVSGPIIGMPVTGPGTRDPQPRRQYQAKFDLATAGPGIIVPIESGDQVIVQLESISIGLAGTNFPACSLQHQGSADGFRFDPIAGTTNITTEGRTVPIPVSGLPFYALSVTTPASGSCLALVTVQVKSNT